MGRMENILSLSRTFVQNCRRHNYESMVDHKFWSLFLLQNEVPKSFYYFQNHSQFQLCPGRMLSAL